MSPSVNRPSRSSSASGFSTRRWIARLSGRAPYAGSQPSSASSSFGLVGHLETQTPLGEPLAQTPELELDDLGELLARQRLERHDLVDAIQELRAEPVAQLVRGADVRGHDDHGVAEVDRAALTVGQASVVEHLQEDVEDLGVRLLDLVEEDDGVRAAADGLRELSALLVADVAGRRTDEPGDGVPLLVLGHVEPHHRSLVVEHELRERAGELGLPDPGRAEEDERADRAVRILDPERARRSAFATASTARAWPTTR